MPFNVASIKDRASRAKDSTVHKFQDTRDRYTSTPMAKTKFAEGGYVPDARSPPPPPPPARSSFASSSRDSYEETHTPSYAAPPSVSLNTKPKIPHTQSQQHASAVAKPPPPPRRVAYSAPDIDKIDWANLSEEDRKEFFNWLDEFFERFLTMKGKAPASRFTPDVVEDQDEEKPAPPTTEGTVYSSISPGRGPPPVVKSWSKPTIEADTPKPGSIDFEMSYPPQATHGCLALDLAYYFHPSTTWDDYWYAEQNPVPPPIKDSIHRIWKGQMMSIGDTKTVNYGVFFSDLSICWWSVSFSMADPSQVERHAEYVPPPEPLSREQLVEASELYGETIAAYAESFLNSGQFCARGECWDLANEGIKYLEQFDYIPKPLQSLNRTHGQLLFKGKALGKNGQVGQWTAADDQVRRGDIIEWRSVKIATVGAQYGAYYILGDPDHTAVITKDVVSSRSPTEGESFLPSELVAIEVVEQGRNNIPPEPKRQTYDMDAFEQGEVWIYRPVPFEVLMGFPELTVTSPRGFPTQTIC